MLDLSSFKAALASFPSGVVIATAVGPDGEHRGFTASAFSSVSMRPPLVLVCLAQTANCFDTFCLAEWFGISLLKPDHEPLAMRFASPHISDKFSPPDHFEESDHGLKIVSTALATLICHKHANYPVGDHAILVGEVESVRLGDGDHAMLRYRRGFHQVGTNHATAR